MKVAGQRTIPTFVRLGWAALATAFAFTLCCGWAAAAPVADPPWQAMDYGPFLTASIEAPEPRTNIAFKGIAINLGANFGGEHNEAVIFDTDLLRYSAGWTGDFVALKGVVFDGEHWAYPRIAGAQVFGNPTAPGWASAGNFNDPRDRSLRPVAARVGALARALPPRAARWCSPIPSGRCPCWKCPRWSGAASAPRLCARSTCRPVRSRTSCNWPSIRSGAPSCSSRDGLKTVGFGNAGGKEPRGARIPSRPRSSAATINRRGAG